MLVEKILSRIYKPAIFLSQFILILAIGCSPAPTEIVVITPTSVFTPTPTAQPTETQIPSVSPPTLPPPTLTTFEPRAVIKIASHFPLSGDHADFGQDILRGTELAVQQLSAPLNGFSYKVELAAYDDQNLVEMALLNAQQIVADPEVLCVVGHDNAAISIAASDIYHLAGLAFIAPSDTEPLLTGRSYLEVNRLIGRTDGQGTAAAQFAKDQGFTNVFIVSQRSGISLKNAESFRVESGNLGIKRLGSVVTSLNAENTDKYVSAIIKAKPDLVYISSSSSQAIPFITELRAAGYMGTILGTDKLDSRSAISAAGSSLIEGGGLFYTVMNPPAQYYSESAAFIQDFHNQYGVNPHSITARAYDSTGICLKAIEEASIAKGGIVPTRAEVAKAIRNLTDYEGMTGTYNFSSHGDPNPMRYYVYQVVSTDIDSWDQNTIVAAYEIAAP